MLSIVVLLLLFSCTSCFMVPKTTQNYRHLQPCAAKATLTEETTWSLRFLLKSVPTEQGKKVDQLFVIEARFIEEEGYEPPQGFIEQIGGDKATAIDKDITTDDESSHAREALAEAKYNTSLHITKSRWILSEDPEDRKDSLWIWGLFEEPLYPFMLLQLETAKLELPGEGGDAIVPLKLFAQISHARDEEKGAILSPAELKVREVETVKADPIGAATVDLYEEVSVGQLALTAL